MSKSLGNFLEPQAVVAAFGADGARYTTLREVAFDRDTEVSWDSFRAALQRGPRQRLRQPRQPHGVDGQPLPRRRAAGAARRPPTRRSARAGRTRCAATGRRSTRCLLHDALAELWTFVGGANKTVDAEQPWTLAKAAKAGDEAAAARLRLVLGDLVEACRLVGLAVAPFMPGAAPRILEQLGHDYPYAADGNDGPDILAAARVGRGRRRAGPRDRHPGAAVPADRGGGRRARLTGLEQAMRLVDSHGHLNADRFDGDVELVVGARAARGPRAAAGPGLERALVGACAGARRALAVARRRGRRPSPRRRQGRRRRLAADRGLGARRPRRSRSARPGSTRTGCSRPGPTSSTTCGATSRSRSRRASPRSSTAARRPGSGTPRTRSSRSCVPPGSTARRAARRSGTGRPP